MRYFSLLLILFLSSCAPAVPTVGATPSNPPATTTLVSPNTPEPTFTLIPATSTNLPTETPTPCDPYSVEYCVGDGHFVFERPVQPPYKDSVDGSYRYASTANGARDPHHGVEIGKDFGTPIQAAADGVVLFAGPDDEAVFSPWRNFYGNLIVLHHDGDLYTLYGHLSRIDVHTGEAVKAGWQIGEMGQSGAATGSHLHFEIRRGNVQDYFSTVNPELWLKPKDGTGALMLWVVDEAGILQRASLTIDQYSGSGEPVSVLFLDTYVPGMAVEENAGLGDVPAGRHRIALVHNGQLYERWIEVQSGRLTQVVFVVK